MRVGEEFIVDIEGISASWPSGAQISKQLARSQNSWPAGVGCGAWLGPGNGGAERSAHKSEAGAEWSGAVPGPSQAEQPRRRTTVLRSGQLF